MAAPDVIVVGAGNAALCAAIAAREAGASVLVLERSPKEVRGGNSAFTGGAFRFSYDGVDDLMRLAPDITEEDRATTDFGYYPEAQFHGDLAEMSSYRADPELIEILARESLPTLEWVRTQGVRFIPIYGRQTYLHEGKRVFWGGLTMEASGGGLGLVDSLFKRAEKMGVEFRYDHKVVDLIVERGAVCGVVAETPDETVTIRAKAVVLAAGGYHANTAWRARYLGPGWDLARARGSRFNTGAALEAALRRGARAHGHWSGCHSVFLDANAGDFGDINRLNEQKNYFTLGIVVNARGERFVDEGEDFRNYNYSRMGVEVAKQPGGRAWQVFDARGVALLPDEYRMKGAARVEAPTIEALAAKMEGIDEAGFVKTVRSFNAAISTNAAFEPAIKDGRATRGLSPNKSNWALEIEEAPFVAYEVVCGVTLTYGGVAISPRAEVLSESGAPLPGLYAAGEMVGGLYYGKYPGGAGLTSGAVFGRIAGQEAAHSAQE
jgi:tricarballylate dehydrogenase